VSPISDGFHRIMRCAVQAVFGQDALRCPLSGVSPKRPKRHATKLRRGVRLIGRQNLAEGSSHCALRRVSVEAALRSLRSQTAIKMPVALFAALQAKDSKGKA